MPPFSLSSPLTAKKKEEGEEKEEEEGEVEKKEVMMHVERINLTELYSINRQPDKDHLVTSWCILYTV